MPKYKIVIYKYEFGRPVYVDADEITCKNKPEANREAKNMADYYKRKWGRMFRISYDVEKM